MKEKKVEIDLISGASAEAFHWEDWINSVMGYLKAPDDALSTKEIEDGTAQWRKRTPCKANLSRPMVTITNSCKEVQNLDGDIQIWTGWPFFDIKTAQFEMNEWMRAAGCLYGYGEMVESSYFKFGKKLEGQKKDC